MLVNPRVLDLAADQAVSFRVVSWELDEVDIRTPTSGLILRRQALRLHSPDFKPLTAEGYVDVTSGNLIEMLLPWLRRSDFLGRRFTIRKDGSGPSGRFDVHVEMQQLG